MRGMRRTVAFGVFGSVLGALFLGGAFALASTTGFVLGSTANAPDALTAVTAQNKDSHGGLNGAMIQLTNSSTGSAATPLALNVGAGRPPLVTNSTTRVPNLNADLLDGVDSTNLLRGPGELLGAKLQVVPGDTGTLIDRSASKPGFQMFASCGDPTVGGSVGISLTNPGTADVVVDRESGVAAAPGIAGAGYSIDPSDEITFSLGLANGHVAEIWVYMYSLDNQPDPRYDGCYFQATGMMK
jgi:hypothetical protein